MTEDYKNRSQLFQGKRKYQTVYGLEGFVTDRTRIELAKGLVIKKATDEFHSAFWTRAKDMGTRKSLHELKENMFFLFHKYEAPPRHSMLQEHEYGDRIRQMLRCFQVGSIDMQFFQNFFGHDKLDLKSAGFGSSGSHYWRSNTPYLVKGKDSQLLKRFAKNFLSYDFENAKSVEVALRRLDYSYDRRSTEDQIIDLIIAFESLFSDSTGEITYKLSIRTATFLSMHYEAEFIFNFMKKAYALRSSIVHGGRAHKMKWDGEEVREREVVELLQNLLRLTLLKLIFNKDKINAKDLIAIIDREILPATKS